MCEWVSSIEFFQEKQEGKRKSLGFKAQIQKENLKISYCELRISPSGKLA